MHTNSDNAVNSSSLPLLWGASAIAEFLGVSTRTAFHLPDKKHIPARQVGGKWVADRDNLIKFFKEHEAQTKKDLKSEEAA